MLELLQGLGWKCTPCSCTGTKGYDCLHPVFRGYVVKTRGNAFRIIKKGMVIDAGHSYQLEDKLKANEIYKQTT